MPDDFDLDAERHALARALRHQLESLRRAGLEWLPRATAVSGPIRSQTEGRQAPLTDGATPAVGGARFAPQLTEGVAPSPRHPTLARTTGPPGTVGPDSVPNAAAPPDRPAVVVPTLGRPPVAPAVNSPVTVPLAASGSLFGGFDFDISPVPASERPRALEILATEVAACVRCAELAQTRSQTVFGVGTPAARLVFIGEAPGGEEDRQGEPFVGRAGQLLTDMITKGMGLARGQVYIANILKCRPPENRTPSFEECANCVGYLEQQIAIIRPEFICMLGLVAAQTLLETTQSLGRLRGRWHSYRGIRTIVTYHPAYLLRSPSFKKQAWEDLQTLMKAMGLPLPKTRGRLEE